MAIHLVLGSALTKKHGTHCQKLDTNTAQREAVTAKSPYNYLLNWTQHFN